MKPKGSSLIEIIVSIFLLGTFFVVMTASLAGVRLNKRNRFQSDAYQFAQIQMEAIRAVPFASLTNRTDDDFIGFPFDLGNQEVAVHASPRSGAQVLTVEPVANLIGDSISSIVLLPTEYYTDFTFSGWVNVDPSSSSGWATGVVFRYQDPENYYFFGINETEIQLLKMVNGIETVLYSDAQANATDVWHELEVVTSGTTITVSYGGIQATQETDSSLSQGSVGFVGFNSPTFYLDDLHLEDPAIADWNFDSDLLGDPADGFLGLSPNLPQFDFDLTISNFNGNANVKEITADVRWQEGDQQQSISISGLKHAPFTP